MTKRDWAVELVALTALAVLIGSVLAAYSGLPDTIATHFNAAGRVDGWGVKGTLLLLPVTSSLMYGVLTVLSRYPQVYNYVVPITAQNACPGGGGLGLGFLAVSVLVVFGTIAWHIVLSVRAK